MLFFCCLNWNWSLRQGKEEKYLGSKGKQNWRKKEFEINLLKIWTYFLRLEHSFKSGFDAY